MSEEQIEKEKLKNTLLIIKQVLESEKDGLNNLFDSFIGNREQLWKIAEQKKIHIQNLEASLDKPYFVMLLLQTGELRFLHYIMILK